MTVKAWGTGKPDYYSNVVASRPVIIEKETVQQDMIQTKNFSIAPGAVAINSFYTVPTGYSLSIGGGHISVKDSCINKLKLTTPSKSLVGDFRFDMQGNLTMSSIAGQLIPSGTTITAYVYNNDTLSSDFSLTLTGTLTRSS